MGRNVRKNRMESYGGSESVLAGAQSVAISTKNVDDLVIYMAGTAGTEVATAQGMDPMGAWVDLIDLTGTAVSWTVPTGGGAFAIPGPIPEDFRLSVAGGTGIDIHGYEFHRST